jgi:hypothetical protein
MAVIIISISKYKTKPMIFYISEKIQRHYSIYASVLCSSIEEMKNISFFKVFLLLKQFTTKENIDENFLDEQMIDMHQDFSMFRN